MNIKPISAVEIRKVDSNKTLMRIDQLNGAEANKVFVRIQFPTRGEGYDKCYLVKS